MYYIKPLREPQGYQRYHNSGQGTIAIQMEKEKTMSISKHVNDHNTTGIARRASATGFVLAQGTHQAEEQGENQIKQRSDREQNLPTDIMNRHDAKRVFLVKRTKP